MLGVGNYRYADYALTCPMLIADLLCCLRAPYKVTIALTVHLMLLSGVVTNFYSGRHWTRPTRLPAVAWFCYGCFWYIIAFATLSHIVRTQYNKLASLAQATDAKRALLPLRIAIATIFSLWVCYPAVWILSEESVHLLTPTGLECVHAFCDIVAKAVYGLTLMRFKAHYDRRLCLMLDKCGMDQEDDLRVVERSLRTHGASPNAPGLPSHMCGAAIRNGSRRGSAASSAAGMARRASKDREAHEVASSSRSPDHAAGNTGPGRRAGRLSWPDSAGGGLPLPLPPSTPRQAAPAKALGGTACLLPEQPRADCPPPPPTGQRASTLRLLPPPPTAGARQRRLCAFALLYRHRG